VNPTKFENCLRETVLYLEDRRDVKSVLLYGSVAVGTAGPESDLDLLIVSPRDSHEELALELERTGGIRGNTRGHLKHIGAMLLIESRMVGRAQIGDKAELLWDHPELEGLNALLEDEFRSTSALRPSTASLSSWLALSARSST